MAGEMAVHLFDVRRFNGSPRLDVLLEQIAADDLTARLKLVGQQEIRAESIQRPNSDGNRSPYWLIDFTKIRFEHGPGKASREEPIEGFDLAEDEGFGEETAALYDPRFQVLLVQYNHFGVRASTIGHYFSLYNYEEDAIRSYDLLMRMDENADLRFASKEVIRKLHFKVAPPKMTSRQRAGNVSLGRALDVSDSLGAETIEVVISAGRSANSSLSIDRARAMVAKLMGMRPTDGDNDPVLTKLEVTGKESPVDPTDVLNLIAPKLEVQIADLELGRDLRYTQQSRWAGLIRARNGWARVLRA